jgi:hypothetical protein
VQEAGYNLVTLRTIELPPPIGTLKGPGQRSFSQYYFTSSLIGILCEHDDCSRGYQHAGCKHAACTPYGFTGFGFAELVMIMMMNIINIIIVIIIISVQGQFSRRLRTVTMTAAAYLENLENFIWKNPGASPESCLVPVTKTKKPHVRSPWGADWDVKP